MPIATADGSSATSAATDCTWNFPAFDRDNPGEPEDHYGAGDDNPWDAGTDRAGRAVAALAKVPAHRHEPDGDRAEGESSGHVGVSTRHVCRGGIDRAHAAWQSSRKRRVPQQRGGQQHRAGSDEKRSRSGPRGSSVVRVGW